MAKNWFGAASSSTRSCRGSESQLAKSMNVNLYKLITDYQASVARATALMQKSGIQMPLTATDWACNGIEQRGYLLGGAKYFKHGFGCAVHLPTGVIDFDFGNHGEINGFCAHRLATFAGARIRDYGFQSEEVLIDCFKTEVDAGSIIFSGYFLYYLAKKSD
jgi:hypothetical protein